MASPFSQKTIRRLTAAEGYLELNMPERAMEELLSIDNAGPLEAVVCWLTGETFKAQERYAEAIAPLERAARLIPAPYNKQAWMSLSECFRHRGEIDMAEIAEGVANATTEAVHTITPLFGDSSHRR
jgi:tetratricopeptide (TPR) repeat protein